MQGRKRMLEHTIAAIPPRRVIPIAISFVLLFALGATTLRAQTPPAPRPVVVLDAAHGGDDAGAMIGNQQEKNLTLALSVKLRSLLMARGFSVVTTRESDTTVDAGQRAETANRANALACLSLHATQAGSGVHLFASSLTPAEGTRLTAWKTTQAAWVTRSLALAGVVNSALGQANVTVTLGRTNLPTIDSMSCPALAIEVAPQRDADAPAAGLEDSTTQAHIAEALAAAMVEWRAEAKGGREP